MSYARLTSAALSLLVTACGGPRLLTVPTGPQPAQAAPIKVEYPPPPAKVEEIMLARGSGGSCVWRDGYWDWTGGRWEWQDGHAVLPAPGCLFAEAKLLWTTDSLSFYRPAWYPDPTVRPAPKTCIEVVCAPKAGSANPDTPAPSP
ncbi:MAG TPA: YXWGXW repeat-containing protein [Polyangiaceae bacterium]|nr:YXWGXW repeat-containing protein [Polyangiaceae bacterium]